MERIIAGHFDIVLCTNLWLNREIDYTLIFAVLCRSLIQQWFQRFLHTSHTSHISHLLLYPSLWILVPGLSSHFLPLFPFQPAFKISTGQQYFGEMATRFCKLWESLYIRESLVGLFLLPIPNLGETIPVLAQANHVRMCTLVEFTERIY